MFASLALQAAVFGHDHYVSRDSAWCWFADPRALWVGEQVLTGGVSSAGDIVANVYNPVTGARQDIVLAKSFQKDDHCNPSFLRLPDGRHAAFFSKHTGPEMFMSTTQGTDITKWSAPAAIGANDGSYKGPSGALNAYTYPNPQLLTEEKGRVYLFWRGMNWKPTVSYSDDMGKTWSTGKIVVSPQGDAPGVRPYAKFAGDGRSAIHMAFTDGHPRNEPTNSVYYARYERGFFTRADGTKVAAFQSLPFRPDQADVVYDGRAEGVRSWIWDVAAGGQSGPVVTYSRLPSEDRHQYRYAWWNGRRWVDRKIVDAGKWFPQTPEGKTEPEPHYSGGVVLDPADPRIVYLSRPVNGRFEIERWFTADGGDTWSHVAVTGNSKHDSVRPFVVRGVRPFPSGPNVLWMNMNKYVHYTDYAGTLQATNEDLAQPVPVAPMAAADKVWGWVRSNPSQYQNYEWTVAPLYSGVLEYAREWNVPAAIEWLREQGRKISYRMGPRKAMADDVAVGQAFLGLYEIDRDPAQIGPVQAWLDGFVTMPHTRGLEWKDGVHNEEMAWCDALFMAPPAMAMLSRITGDAKYAKRMNELWWKTSDYLYDPSEQLYFRDSRYFGQKEANGKKVFWSRGNGWVLAGLARVLDNLPEDSPDRGGLERQFVAMANRLAGLQTPDGTWHASLLDPRSFPNKETSGTGFYVYAMAWGINQGLLPRARFEPVVKRGYAALCSCVDLNGKLGWVQPVGQDPRVVKASDTDAYGVGAFLLASVQVARMR